ncbi:MAG: GNAT family N-acetyltransferase [Candidatus Sabulitectum sp.]|nr:GNAT family N-acetyltransferase [Candidatus Sabulitectum sp.]
MRGKGVGGRLFDEVADYAKEHDYDRVRLDVIDINSKAKIYMSIMALKR